MKFRCKVEDGGDRGSVKEFTLHQCQQEASNTPREATQRDQDASDRTANETESETERGRSKRPRIGGGYYHDEGRLHEYGRSPPPPPGGSGAFAPGQGGFSPGQAGVMSSSGRGNAYNQGYGRYSYNPGTSSGYYQQGNDLNNRDSKGMKSGSVLRSSGSARLMTPSSGPCSTSKSGSSAST
jgi:hypothetical protein